MDIDEAKVYAAEQTIDALCSGRDFKGLGSHAGLLILGLAEFANSNAKHLSKTTGRTPEKFQAMKKHLTERFVLSICGFAEERITPVEAAHDLVQGLWEAYIDWAREPAPITGQVVGTNIPSY